MKRELFQNFILSTNKKGSGKANSYMRALDLLSEMIKEEPKGFADCENIWEVSDEFRLNQLYNLVLEEAEKGPTSAWALPSLPSSYLEKGYCSAALRSYVDFLSSGDKLTSTKEKLRPLNKVSGFVYGKDGFVKKKRKYIKKPKKKTKEKTFFLEVDDYLDLGDLNNLQLSNKAKRCLRRSGVDSIEKLTDISDEQLLATPWTGEGTVRSIRNALIIYQKEPPAPNSTSSSEEGSTADCSALINDVLNLSVRAKNCLSHISTIDELTKLSTEDLLGIRNMGKGTAQEILGKLRDYNGPGVVSIDKDSLDSLNLSYKARKCALLMGKESISELEKITDQDVLSTRGMGRKTLNEIREKVASYILNHANQAPASLDQNEEFCPSARRMIKSGADKFNVHPKLLNSWRNLIKQKKYDELMIREVCFEADLKWPSKKSDFSEMLIKDLLDLSWSDLLDLKSFGKTKAHVYHKALAYLAAGLWEKGNSGDSIQEMNRIIDQLPGLKEIEVAVLEERIGKDGSPKTLELIASTKNVTRERIRQIQKSGLRKLRTTRNLETINDFLTANEKQIWYLLGGVKGIISESDKFDNLAEELPFKFRFGIQVYTGSKVSGERFPNVLRAFLKNRYKFASGCWYNVPIDPDEIEMLIILLLGEFSDARPVVLRKSLLENLSKFGDEKVEYALSMSEDIHSYRGYLSKQKFSSLRSREVNLHIILNYLSKGSRPVFFDRVFICYNMLNPLEQASYRTVKSTMEKCPSFFCSYGQHEWISVGQAEDFQQIYPSAEGIDLLDFEIDYRKELPEIPRILYDFLRKKGVSYKADILKETETAEFRLNPVSLSYYLGDHGCFIQFCPNLWGLREMQSDKDLIEQCRKEAFEQKNYNYFILSKYAGFETSQFPLWDTTFEKELLNWAETCEDSDDEILLSFITGKASEAEAQSILQSLNLFPPSLKEKDFKFPNSVELMSAIIWLRDNKSISWMQANYLAGRSLISKKGVCVMYSLRLLGLVEPLGDCFQSHLANSISGSFILELMHGKGRNWDKMLSEKISKDDPLKKFGRSYFFPKFIRKKKRITTRKKRLNPYGQTEITFSQRSLENRLQQIRLLIERTGKFEVSRRSSSYVGLRVWMDQQRVKKRKGILSLELEKSLEELGFEWEVEPSPYAASKERLAQLKQLKEKKGTFEVSRNSSAYPGLRQWIDQQRSKKRRGKLSTNIEIALTELEFDWLEVSSLSTSSEERLVQLRQFKEENGTFDVSRNSQSYPGLRQWMDQLRYKKRRGKLSTNIEIALTELEFEWEAESSPYEASKERLAQLKQLKEEHGTFEVSRNSSAYPGLRQWIDQQRSKKRRGKLSSTLKDELDGLGFE